MGAIFRVHIERLIQAFHPRLVVEDCNCRDSTVRVSTLQGREINASVVSRRLQQELLATYTGIVFGKLEDEHEKMLDRAAVIYELIAFYSTHDEPITSWKRKAT